MPASIVASRPAPQPTRNAHTILIIDDDDELRESLSEQLSLHDEFETQLAATTLEGLKLVGSSPVDLILLDVGLPDVDGYEACRLLRRGGFKRPIIMLTAKTSDADTILGLESGADDYMTKPFKLGVLLARIRAQLRQHELSEDAVFTVGPYTFQPAAKLLLDGNGGRIGLIEKVDPESREVAAPLPGCACMVPQEAGARPA
jgi:DNA-binding response OmpR family regulator